MLMDVKKYLRGESDALVGRRMRLSRYLICSMQGHFPVLIKTGASSLAVIYRTGAAHVGISGTLATARSDDGGRSWSDPIEIAPRWDDNRNPAFGLNARGEWLAAWWKARLHAYADLQGNGLQYMPAEDDERIGAIPALYYARSADLGRTWSEAMVYRSNLLSLASPYGRILSAPDGTLLMSVYGRPREDLGCKNIAVLLRSRDGGATWGEETLVVRRHNETSYVLLPDGRLVGAARSESGHVAILFSDDLGRTWSEPRQVTRDGEHPADLTLLASGRLLLTFGRRIRPLGCGALLSDDGGQTWHRDREVLLAGDGIENTDLGYPSTVQLDDGTIVTALYYASGSEMSADWRGWGRVSCQAIHYREEDLV
ncbi:MAG: exo-alpha-sialidase [Chloroflexi bacterium]|nr:exo-alpha-sialidase [Chloroflexota bacterium]